MSRISKDRMEIFQLLSAALKSHRAEEKASPEILTVGFDERNSRIVIGLKKGGVFAVGVKNISREFSGPWM